MFYIFYIYIRWQCFASRSDIRSHVCVCAFNFLDFSVLNCSIVMDELFGH